MRLILTDPARLRVIAVLAGDAASAARNPAYEGLLILWTDKDVYEGSPVPEDASSNPPPPAESLADYASRRRWEVEVGGTTWGGFPVATDDRSKTLVNGELSAIELAVRQDGEPFKFADGMPRPLSNAEMQAVAIAMRAHVKATFGALFGVMVGIQTGTVTTRAEVDAILAGAAS